MLYIQDLFYRLKYFFVALFLFIITLYFYRDLYIYYPIVPTFLTCFPIKQFIFIEPKEIFSYYLSSGGLLAFFFLFPYFVFNFIDFFKPALYKKEWFLVKDGLLIFFFFYCLLNIIITVIIFPFFWQFFIDFNQLNSITFFLEITINKYLNFFISILLLSNLFLFVLLTIILISCIFSFNSLIKLKSVLVALLIIISTLITPPSVESQILIFIFLYVCFEMVIFLFFIYYIYRDNLFNAGRSL